MTGFVDGWTFIKPLNGTTLTGSINRSSINYVGERFTALEVTWGGPGQGIKRTIATEPGKLYQLNATVKDINPVTGSAIRRFNLRVGNLTGLPATFTRNDIIVLPARTFLASSTSTVIELVATDAAAATTAKILVFDLSVEVMDTALPQRFLNTSFTGSLADHLDLAVNSVGAAWFVDRYGAVQFTPPPELLPVLHTFSDKRSDTALEYTDIEYGMGYATDGKPPDHSKSVIWFSSRAQ